MKRKQVHQIPVIRCESHPTSNICSVQVEQQCPYKSRLACVNCLQEYKSKDNLIDINDFRSTQSVITRYQNIKGFNNPIIQYLIETEEQYQGIIDNFIQQLHSTVDALEASLMKQLDNQKQYFMKTAELRIQYDAELTNLQNKIQSVTQLSNYHNTKEWLELQECFKSYITLLYQPEIQEIKVTFLGLNASIPKRFELYPIQEFKDYIGRQFDHFCKQQPFVQFTQTILNGSIFNNSIIDRITDNGQKSMKLLFNGLRDGMNAAAFWKHCENKGPTITICESQSGQIFGGYTPCKWITNQSQQDASMTSFLFSVTKEQIYPLKQNEYAIDGSVCRIRFGSGQDLDIQTDFKCQADQFGYSYNISKYQIADRSTHLLGAQSTQLESIEVYLIE